MAEMQKLLNRLIAKHTRGVLRWRKVASDSLRISDIIQAVIGNRAAPRRI